MPFKVFLFLCTNFLNFWLLCNKTVSGCFLYKRLLYCNCSFVGWVQCMRNGKETIKRKKSSGWNKSRQKKVFFIDGCEPATPTSIQGFYRNTEVWLFINNYSLIDVIITHLVFQMLQKVYLRSISSLSPNNLSEPKHYYNVYTAKYSVSSQLMIYLKQNYY